MVYRVARLTGLSACQFNTYKVFAMDFGLTGHLGGIRGLIYRAWKEIKKIYSLCSFYRGNICVISDRDIIVP